MGSVTGRLMLVDPMPAFCQSLAAALPRHSVEVVGWTTDEREARTLADRHRPDVVMTEIALDAGSGIELASQLSRSVRVVILTRGDVGEILLDAVGAGAVGCLDHSLTVSQLASLMLQPDASFVHDPDALLGALQRASSKRADPTVKRLDTLTPREREVLRLLAEGMDDERIAARLFLSTNTVRTHVGRILRKLGVHSRADAIRAELEGGPGSGTARGNIARITGPELG